METVISNKVFFGSFECSLPKNVVLPKACMSKAEQIMSEPFPSAAEVMRMNRARAIERRSLEQQRIASEKLDFFIENTDRSTMKLSRKQQYNLRKKENWCFKLAEPVDITSMSIGGGVRPSSVVEVQPMGKIHTTPSAFKPRKMRQSVGLSARGIDNLINFVRNTMANQQKSVEVVGKRAHKIDYIHLNNKVRARISVHHLSGIKKQVDLRLERALEKDVQILARTRAWNCTCNADDLQRGSSGIILNPLKLKGFVGRNFSGLFIVRGRFEGMLIDARSKITVNTMLKMVHYSKANEFWSGFDGNWNVLRTDVDHTCTSNFTVAECGEIAAILSHCILPCYKIVCAKCADKYTEKTFSELIELLHVGTSKGLEYFERKSNRFAHVKKFMSLLNQLTDPIENTHANFEEIFNSVGVIQRSPFKHINELNSFFLRGRENTAQQWAEAHKHLVELNRFQRNRTDNMKKGELALFRNKAPSKGSYNMYLSCDNQLDKNGNFLWGQREYHAKRFFSNFFDVVNPENGYDRHKFRRSRSGIRKLAIGNLIVSLDLATFRQQMNGEYVKQPDISKQCVSMKDGGYIYSCCCVTTDDGKAVQSGVYAPTKKHLVIGNSGDAKYVDLPKGETEMLYIAKEGFCYINIFLAMLINISEDEAKDFTKKVRDIFIPKLGQWPSLMDVATVCAQLRIFYPDVHDAELPRILVDHVSQTCHVVDSFGSITTGYHILKAATVNQLILFADNALESEIKHYSVGGKLPPPPENADSLSDGPQVPKMRLDDIDAIKLLLSGIFKPNRMRFVLENEPYVILMTLVSPGILMAMYNNGGFEQAIKIWINKRQNIAVIATMLSTLARKVSVAETLYKQHQIILSASSELYDKTMDGFHTYLSYRTALDLLVRLKFTAEGDTPLIAAGFFNYEDDVVRIIEKSYLDLLAQEWRGLRWWEKLSATWRSYSLRPHGTEQLAPTKSVDLKGVYSISPKAIFGRTSQRVGSRFRKARDRFYVFIEDRWFSVSSFCMKRLLSRLPSFLNFVNSLVVMSSLFSIFAIVRHSINEFHRGKIELYRSQQREKEGICNEIYWMLRKKLGREPYWEEYINQIRKVNPSLLEYMGEVVDLDDPNSTTPSGLVHHQNSFKGAKNLEQVIAFTTLVMMVFDSERSDCVFKTLNKFKGVMSSLNSVHHQSLDDIVDVLEDRNQVVDFELSDSLTQRTDGNAMTFGKWWDYQIENGRTMPHYRTEGLFIEFTRANAAKVASDIFQSEAKDFLVRGAVGSGKSTGLPYHLSATGRVLLIEPTRPLAENVWKQLSNQPFFQKPTMRMRGSSVFGSSPITIMTSGFALHYYANNTQQLRDFSYIIIDECHVMDASAMAFRSVIQAYHSQCKVLKVSATPPGREVEFQTQFPVTLKIEESLSFKQFTEAQGTGANADVLTFGCNILVYVASYADVDSLSKLLVDKHYRVSKVDGRTMKHGNLEINTLGTKEKPHFIVATNIIENGVTLDIEVVVDFGLKVSPALDVDSRCVSYRKVSVSYGERIQRLGRVGRFKAGLALRIGSTEKGLVEVPSMIATEAALNCFAYNLPVMSGNVSTSLLANCTVKQVKTMLNFELSPFFSFNFVSHDGSMHPVIHELLRKYKLRDSTIPLSDLSIPYKASAGWLSVREYVAYGVRLELQDDVKVAFHIKDVPQSLHEELWKTVLKYKHQSLFPSIKAASISKIAYTLSTDLNAITRTLMFVETLIEEERIKQGEFRSLIDNGCSSMFSVIGISNTLRARYAQDYTSENIQKLEAIKNQLLEFKNVQGTSDEMNLIRRFETLQFVHHQSKNELVKALHLKGIWSKSLIAKDFLIAAAVAVGGVCMMWSWFKDEIKTVHHQGKSKSKRIQALKFRRARDKRAGFEIDNNEDTIEEFFGSAYTKKGKGKGTTVGLGKTSRRFVNMYGFEPGEYSFIRFVDPLTGAQVEENVYADILDVQEQFGEVRDKMVEDGDLDRAYLNNNTIHAYFIKDWSTKALKVDLTPHNPLRVSDKSSNIMKFPERETELRQTGPPIEVDLSQIPQSTVVHEAKALLRGLRDYNPIAQTICQLTVNTENGRSSTHGIGFGALILANHHLFKSFNGQLEVRSHHGVFKVPNMKSLSVVPLKGRDLIVVRMPKDFPLFPQRLHFRKPKDSERVLMVGSNFQEKSISSTVTETSPTHPVNRSTFWKHWISTSNGHCGLPLVSTLDGCIVGLHSLANFDGIENYFASFDDEFEAKYLRNQENLEWVKDWKYNPDKIVWGALQLESSSPEGLFKTTKLVEDIQQLFSNSVREQAKTSTWVYDALRDNLVATGYMKNQLITKHVVKGECMYFQQYLAQRKQAESFFKPKMWAYGKSRLNREAYVKDLLKYAEPIEIGVVNCELFEEAVRRVILYLSKKGFRQCNYITDESEIFRALNMKSAVGALYGGKKKEFFESFTDQEKEQIVRDSCFRQFSGKLGVWNGSLKAEIRSKEKIEENKTRTFTAAPIDVLLAGKVCVDDFNNQFYSMNTDCCWTVGMTKFYGGWNRLLEKLPEGWVYCDADGSRFDSSLTPYLINAVLTIRCAYMEEWDLGYKMLQNLYTEIVYTPIATPDGTVVKKFRGNNSGQPSTVVDNSLMVILAMHYALLKEGVEFDEIDATCIFFVNGDDLLLAINPQFEHMLDNFSQHFHELGLNYTFDSRTREKSDLWFMSHRGIQCEGIYIPKLEEERIVSILQWDRAAEPEHRLEAVCAAMIEAWGYPSLLHEIRVFYLWLLEQTPFKDLASEGRAPYISEMALKKLYTNQHIEKSELDMFLRAYADLDDEFECSTYSVYHQELVYHQANEEQLDAARTPPTRQSSRTPPIPTPPPIPDTQGGSQMTPPPVQDVNAGTSGTFTVPRIKSITSKMRMPKVLGKTAMNLDHLLVYTPNQIDISNTRATQSQFDTWYSALQTAYDVSESEMSIIANGLMVWCIENGTSPNINGVWTMMDGEEQVEYPLKPVVENAKPTLRQIMAHFSDVAEAYIEMRNRKEPYMPRYGIQRNLRDMSLARYAFDFFEVTSRTPNRAREAHIQMKAAALKSAQTRLFGLDGGISTQEENTERHTTEDVNPNMHSLLGVRNM